MTEEKQELPKPPRMEPRLFKCGNDVTEEVVAYARQNKLVVVVDGNFEVIAFRERTRDMNGDVVQLTRKQRRKVQAERKRNQRKEKNDAK